MDSICKAAIESLGETTLINIAIEELDKLTHALISCNSGIIKKREINEDIADCYIMLVTLAHIFIDEECPSHIKQIIETKLENLERRIESCQQSTSTE